MNSYEAIDLYAHNTESLKKIKKAFNSGENTVGIVHATGTGKSYNALTLAYENKDKKIIYVVPSNGIIEHIKNIIKENPNLDLNRDFPNLEFRTYQSFINLSRDEIKNINCDLLILDEFHHLGAPVWGSRINNIIETHPHMQIFGMTAYTVRDRGTAYERDMANPDKDELFSNKIVSTYDLCDAMIDKVLPKPIYKTAYINLLENEKILEERVKKLNPNSKEYKEYIQILEDIKKRIHEAPSIPNILKKNIKQNGKYIYFCPPYSEQGTNDIETIKKEAIEWFKKITGEDNIVLYTTTSEMGEKGTLNRDAFYNDTDLDGNDVSNKLRVMFAINQYNEGVHAPNIDGVIMGRGTSSDIVYFEQLGRALSVRGNSKEEFEHLDNYPLEYLLKLCRERSIPIKEGTSKNEIIQTLVAPIVIDLTNNFGFIKELENNLKDRIRQSGEKNEKNNEIEVLEMHERMKLSEASFDIEVENQDLYEMLRYVSDRLSNNWDVMYEHAKSYYEHHGNLEVPFRFKTTNGYEYDENGVNLGTWINTQRQNKSLSSEREEKLSLIGIRFKTKNNDEVWNKMYEHAKNYYEHHGDLKVPRNFKTTNGYDYDENGVNLGYWISKQRTTYKNEKISEERIAKLNLIGMQFENINSAMTWDEMYEHAKSYYEHHGNLEVPFRFKTTNGYDYDENGVNLGRWISTQRSNKNLSKDRKEKLSLIGMRFENIKSTKPWDEMYEYAKSYYEHHGNLEVPFRFKTTNGYEYDENGVNLGEWIGTQRTTYKNEKISEERIAKLNLIGMQFENINRTMTWDEMYEHAKSYYEHHGNLEVPLRFKTTNGYDYDENGVNLGGWISTQRKNKNLSSKREEKLSLIGMRFKTKNNDEAWNQMYEHAKSYYEHHGDLKVPRNFKTTNGYEYDENGINLGGWINIQRKTYKNEKISEEKIAKLNLIGMIWSHRKNKDQIQAICDSYSIDSKQNKKALNHISVQELQSKIAYLNENGMEIIDESGKLHEIFSMSNPDMQEKYKVELETLINTYYSNKTKGAK